MLPGSDPAVLRALDVAAPGAVAARASDRLAHAHDASHYRKVPQAVVAPRDVAEVAALLRAARRDGFHLTFRSGGTSLSGQASSDGVLLDTRRHFRDIHVLDSGRRVRVQPGATVRAVNARLARHGTRLGPDPASEIACTIGGVVANNSSGMACGTHANTYRTLQSAILVLPSGVVLDTGRGDADETLRGSEPALHRGLEQLRDRVRGDAASVATVERLFSLKNTMGYGLNSFLDFERPVDVLAHLVVGSEGTLAFVAEATFRTVPAPRHVATGLLVFPHLADATASLPSLVRAGFATLELLDATSLRVAQTDPGADDLIRTIEVDHHAALLVEHQHQDPAALVAARAVAVGVFADLPLVGPVELTDNHERREALWRTRKGLYTAVAGARPSGTTALLEDIAVPVPALLPTCEALTALFDQHRYEGSVIFGHAKDGNIHFLLNERFDRPESVERYTSFTEDMVDLVLGHGGTLKAEHGTGRVMAPYVRRQYGDELYDVMVELKRLVDPHGLLNPGVLLDEDPDGHLTDLKTTPTVEEEVDRCVECGYCEPVCPSRDLTTTPRQRIVLRRELARAAERGDARLVEQVQEEYEHDAVETCAVDGMCQTACPVLINTGDLVRRLRGEDVGRLEQTAWRAAASHWSGVTRAASRGLTSAQVAPAVLARGVTAAARVLGDPDVVPAWSSDLPRGGAPRRGRDSATPEAVFFATCATTMFGPADDGPGVRGAFLALCERAGVEVRIPRAIASWCCGTPWKSKGLREGYDVMSDQVLPGLWAATEHGRLPIVSDASSCTEGLQVLLRGAAETGRPMRVVDAVTFVEDVVVPRLPMTPRRAGERVVVHPTCSSTHLGTTDALVRLASLVGEAIVPTDWGCCAFAGDRGMLHPQLTAAATAAEAAEVRTVRGEHHVSSNRTCELGMTRATGHRYRHVLELLEEATR